MFGDVDADEICVKLGAIKKNLESGLKNILKGWINFFQRGKIRDAEQRRRFLV